ncbi:MFS multidrug transporter [Colletotrichum sojae]|uniref:MFS multidrug transporter n=1 Tax=Colletotrichum sojae TaxID=2175907 RepID=A0A8H6MYT1_9PEZI|nr:MFS multidrug transporter [Colletotrichum sojae]
MATLFCCDSIKPYKAQRTDHETKFLDFMFWTKRVVKDSDISSESTSDKVPSYTIQLVRQVNYGPLESRRYFARFDHISDGFVEVSENFLIQANFQKVNSAITSRPALAPGTCGGFAKQGVHSWATPHRVSVVYPLDHA